MQVTIVLQSTVGLRAECADEGHDTKECKSGMILFVNPPIYSRVLGILKPFLAR
jgi:hypothetical protein